jgi:hypothetical protein
MATNPQLIAEVLFVESNEVVNRSSKSIGDGKKAASLGRLHSLKRPG